MITLNVFSVALLSLAAMAFALAAYALREARRRSVPGGVEFATLSVGSGLWVGIHGLRVGATTRESFLFLVNAEWVGILLVAPAWLLFVLAYTGPRGGYSRRFAALLAVQPVVTLVLVWANPDGLFRVVEAVSVGGPGLPTATLDHGPLYPVTILYVYAMVIAGSAVLVRATLQVPQLYRGRTVALLVAATAPLLGSVPTVVDAPLVPGLVLGPVAFAVSLVAFAVALFGHELLRVVPLTPTVASEAVVAEMAAGVVVLDANGEITQTNPAAERFIGDDDAVGRRLESVQSELAMATDGGLEEEQQRLLLSGEDDRERYVDVESTPVYRGRGLYVGQLLTLQDVTDRVLREQRLNVLNRVLRHNVRHETNLILGHGETIAEELSAAQREGLETMLSSAEQLVDWSDRARFAERALDGVDGERRAVPLGPTIDHAVDRVRRASPDASIETPESVDAVVLGHSTLEWALYELVDNAVEHGTPTDGETATTDVRVTVTDDGDSVTVEIADTGPGIPPAERRVLAADEETPLEHGSGLGLWLVNWAVMAAGGEVNFAENDPRGTIVRVTLPRAT
ncbi:histidine kinase N-terminal 7TM domain-containing protein [Haloarchaeobius salinus]|uniref:histidine kinase N-terminal 7TM domain-containing protein n=1 Tax=Haloarchaeobius salinus TaxID=1198298 RepID=UPI00210C2FFD|nr:histidine kinase N-terminal 7TM domain-containing protein [Haloarchaeobius salinus]